MNRWTTVKFLESYNVTLYEQALFIAKGLPVYNDKGLRVVQANYGEEIPCGCVPFTNQFYPYCVGDVTYYRWLDAPDGLRDFMYMTRELSSFLLERQDKPKIYDIIQSLPKSLLGDSVIDYKEKFLKLQAELKSLKLENAALTNKNLDTKTNEPRTEKALLARQTKSRKEWASTLEKAVSLAVACARSGRPKSTKQHKDMWCKLFGERNDQCPRSEGFEAFRRGLPPDLKVI